MKLVKSNISFFIFIIIWEVVAFTYEVPHLLEIIKFMIFSENSNEIFLALINTIWPVGKILILGIILGYVFGLFIGTSVYAYSILYDLMNAIRSIPITILIPLYIIVFKLENFLVPLIVTPIVALISVNVAQACKAISLERNIQFKFLNFNYLERIGHVYFWETLEVTLSTLRIAVGYALALQIAIDYFLGFDKGLGHYVYVSYISSYNNSTISMISGIFIVSIIGIILVKIVDFISKKTLKWL